MSEKVRRAIRQRAEKTEIKAGIVPVGTVVLERLIGETAERHWAEWVNEYGVEAARAIWRHYFPKRVLPG